MPRTTKPPDQLDVALRRIVAQAAHDRFDGLADRAELVNVGYVDARRTSGMASVRVHGYLGQPESLCVRMYWRRLTPNGQPPQVVFPPTSTWPKDSPERRARKESHGKRRKQ